MTEATPRLTQPTARARRRTAPAWPAGPLGRGDGRAEQARWVAQMLAWEAAERGRRSLERRLRAAHIGRFKPLADFDWAWPRQHRPRAVRS
jgi:hypothetical protein